MPCADYSKRARYHPPSPKVRRTGAARYAVCMFSRFLDFLFPPRTDEALVRGISETDFLALLDPRPASETNAVALLPYRDPRVRAVIHEAKYRGSERAFVLLAAALTDYLADPDVGRQTSHMRLVPVPLGAKRRQERGYNQAEEIARRAGGALGIEILPDALRRTRETASQVSLPRAARLENMRGAFGAAHSLDPTYLYIVIDDVVTTGATLSAATDALQHAGAENVLALALAH